MSEQTGGLPPTLTKAATDVLAERERQKSKEGWTEGHDDQHDSAEMAAAGGCYLSHAGLDDASRTDLNGCVPKTWPWDNKWWKPKTRREDLVRGAALALAEIERLDRLAAKKANPA